MVECRLYPGGLEGPRSSAETIAGSCTLHFLFQWEGEIGITGQSLDWSISRRYKARR